MREAKCPSAAALLSGSAQECPFEKRCPCHKGAWCRQKREQARQSHRDYRMLTLEGCRDGHCDHPCELLLHVEDQARQFLKAAGIAQPPVPLDLVKTFDPERSVEIRFLPLHAHYGAVWLLDDEWVLHLNANQSLPMSRYVAFHEGYHIVCRVSAMYAGAAEGGCRSFNEATADYFAASVLMPREWVLEYWHKVHNVARLAQIFEAPEAAMRSWIRRWVEL